MVSPPAAQSMSVVINDPMCGMEHALTHDHMPEKTSQSLVISWITWVNTMCSFKNPTFCSTFRFLFPMIQNDEIWWNPQSLGCMTCLKLRRFPGPNETAPAPRARDLDAALEKSAHVPIYICIYLYATGYIRMYKMNMYNYVCVYSNKWFLNWKRWRCVQYDMYIYICIYI